MILDRGHLVVATFAPQQALTFVKLDASQDRGRVVDRRTDPTFRGPSGVARARNFYLVVNFDFPLFRTPFTISGLLRNDDEDDEW